MSSSQISYIESLFDGQEGTLIPANEPENSYPIRAIDQSPCSQACPAGVNVKAYVSLISSGSFKEALEVVRERNPLPGICGRICTHPCEAQCNRSQIDDPVAICALKRFVADYELAHPGPPKKPVKTRYKEKVAVIGSGPSGLTTANDLVRRGYKVTIFEARDEPGGMLIAGIPAFRLPRDIIQTEISAIIDLGVELVTGKRIAGKNALQSLLEKDYQAIYLAIGAHKGKKLNIPGEDRFSGVRDCLEFLDRAYSGNIEYPGDTVVVIGGGNSAIDSARTARRLGCKDVRIVYRRTRKEMPANEKEIKEAEAEGVSLSYLAAPVRGLGKAGKVRALRCVKMELGDPDESGRRRPLPVEGSEFEIEADTIIAAVSQEPDIEFLSDTSKIDTTHWHTIAVDSDSLVTGLPGVFAGGDAVTGPKTVIEAIAHGHRAAESIHRYLRNHSNSKTGRIQGPEELEFPVNFEAQESQPRRGIPSRNPRECATDFDEVEVGFDEATAIAEARRCLRCGPCYECEVCVSDCGKFSTILHGSHGDGELIVRFPEDLRDKFVEPLHQPAQLVSPDSEKIALEISSIFPIVMENLCRGCGDCTEVCEYDALKLVHHGENLISEINHDLCRGCGTCVALCPNSALRAGYFGRDGLTVHLESIDPERRNIVVFSCKWNGSNPNGRPFPDMKSRNTNIIFIQYMCTGRIEPSFVLQALESGADGVLIAGCGDEDCHYDFGIRRSKQSYQTLRNLVRMLGFDSRRIRFSQVPDRNPATFISRVNRFVQDFKRTEKTSTQSEPA